MIAFFEDRRAPEGEPAVWRFHDLVDCIEVRSLAELEAALIQLEQVPMWTVMALDYELGYLLEPRAAPSAWQAGTRPLARFWRFGRCETTSVAAHEAFLASMVGPAGIVDCRPGVDENAYLQAVDRIQAYIADGDCYQVNFTLPLDFSWFGTPLALYARLRERQPVRYGGFVGDQARGIVSLSPELFLTRCGSRLTTRPMKGTAPRTQPVETLLASTKDRAENLMIVDLLRNDLGKVAKNGSVQVEELFAVEAYPTVWQMVSQVSAEVGEAGFGEVLKALFPCGSITGAPKLRAMQIIGELEREPRGLYTGALGWMSPKGDFRLNVAIRTLQLAADRRGRMGVGSGVVADSRARDEWRECLLKASFATACEPGVQLIETLRCEAGVYPRLEGHLARLSRSAAALAFPCDLAVVREKLASTAASGCWRVRLTLDRAGEIVVERFALGAEPAGPRYACLAETAIEAAYPLRRHKTTDRALYDAALREIADRPEIFDVVFCNERGEVAEGARSTVFVERDGRWLTPSLSSGALPGVLRAELLADGRAQEATLYPADLESGFWLGNALRGLVWVTLR